MRTKRAVLAFVFLGGCASRRPPRPIGPPPDMPLTPALYAPAPAWMFANYLGAPLDAHFQPIQGQGTTLFPDAPIVELKVDDFRHEKIEIRDMTSFDANISAWGPSIGLSAGVGTANDYRFAAYHAYDVHVVQVVDDRYPMAAPPPGAVWYAARLYWGHSYEELCFGDKNHFTTEVAAKIEFVSGGVSSIATSSGVKCKLAGRGLKAKPGGIYAGSPAEVRASYIEDGTQSSPVFVEYRMIPGVVPPPNAAIAWVAPFHVEVRYTEVDIGYQSNWWDVNYYATGSCTLNGEPIMATPQVLNGGTGTTNTKITTAWIASMSATAGDKVSCGLHGHFIGTIRSGSMPDGAMSPPFEVAGPGVFPGEFHGSNSDTRYTVRYIVTVSPGQ